jgi:hypothetical protein
VRTSQQRKPSKIEEWKSCPIGTIDWNGFPLGQNYSAFPVDAFFKDQRISIYSDACIAVMVALGVHANHDLQAFPSDSRLGILAGIHFDNCKKALSFLQDEGEIATVMGQRKRYQLNYMKIRTGDSWFPIFQSMVYRGIWAKLKPSAKKLYVVMDANSVPYKMIPEYLHDEEYEIMKIESGKDTGQRMLIGYNVEKHYLNSIIKLPARTFNDAQNNLIDAGLIEPESLYSRYIINNVPARIYEDVIDRLVDQRRFDTQVSASTKAAITKQENNFIKNYRQGI